MDDPHELPEDDRDLQHARRLGDLLDAGDDPASAFAQAGSDDARLADALRALRARGPGPAPPPDVSARLWERIEAGIDRPAPAADRAPLRRASRQRPAWAAAAVAVVMAGAVAWLLLGRAPGPRLVAEAGAEAVTLTLADGSAVTLRPHSSLHALEAEPGAMRFRLEGEALFDVVTDPARAFAVEAGTEAGAARVTVAGTRFDVSTWGGQVQVYLAEGRVRFEHLSSGRTVVLAPGQRSAVTGDGRLLAPEAAPGAAYLDWLEGELTFDARSLRDVLDELAHHYGITFDIPPALLDETLSGTLRLDGAAESVDDLATVLGGRFEEARPGTYRFVPIPTP